MDKKQREEEHLSPLLLVDEGLLLLTHQTPAQLGHLPLAASKVMMSADTITDKEQRE